jgi:hypothetical protein
MEHQPPRRRIRRRRAEINPDIGFRHPAVKIELVGAELKFSQFQYLADGSEILNQVIPSQAGGHELSWAAIVWQFGRGGGDVIFVAEKPEELGRGESIGAALTHALAKGRDHQVVNKEQFLGDELLIAGEIFVLFVSESSQELLELRAEGGRLQKGQTFCAHSSKRGGLRRVDRAT